MGVAYQVWLGWIKVWHIGWVRVDMGVAYWVWFGHI